MLTDHHKDTVPLADMSADAARQRKLRHRGLLIAGAATASVSLNFVTAKYAMEVLEPLTFVPLWFAAATVYASVYGLGHRRQWAPQLRRFWKPLVGIGLLSGVGSLLVFSGLHMLDPTVVSFIGRSDALFLILLGFMVLGERFTVQSGAGMLLALAGLGIISYATGAAQIWAVVMVITGYFAGSLHRLVSKFITAATNPVLYSWMRATTITVGSAALALGTGHFHIVPSPSHLIVLAVGAFFGPFLAQVLYHYSLRYIGLSELAIMRATQPLFVALYASVLLGMVPTPKQIGGGLLLIVGAILMAKGGSVEQAKAKAGIVHDS